jgi:hypothetical protein
LEQDANLYRRLLKDAAPPASRLLHVGEGKKGDMPCQTPPKSIPITEPKHHYMQTRGFSNLL